MAEAEDILKLIDSAAKMSRDDLREVMRNHLTASEQVIANVSALKTVGDATRILELALSPEVQALTKANPT